MLHGDAENRLPLGPERDKFRPRRSSSAIRRVQAERLTRTISAPDTVLDRQLAFFFSAGAAGHQFRRPDSAIMDLRVHQDGVLRLLVPRERVTASNADIFILWMIGSSLVLIVIAALFLRNQVKPIERLAYAAENFGKGRTIPEFKPHGATEVRRAATAFIEMRERIDRFVQQRTEMLAGISRDLKTPLTRMRLQLAMMPQDADAEAMAGDIADMERMLNEYLEFARGEGGDAAEPADLAVLAAEGSRRCRPRPCDAQSRIALTVAEPHDGDDQAATRSKRCLVNLIDNALKYGAAFRWRCNASAKTSNCRWKTMGPASLKTAARKPSVPSIGWTKGAICKTGGVGLGLPSRATSRAPMATMCGWSEARSGPARHHSIADPSLGLSQHLPSPLRGRCPLKLRSSAEGGRKGGVLPPSPGAPVAHIRARRAALSHGERELALRRHDRV